MLNIYNSLRRFEEWTPVHESNRIVPRPYGGAEAPKRAAECKSLDTFHHSFFLSIYIICYVPATRNVPQK